MKKIIFSVILLCAAFQVFSQNQRIFGGVVTDISEAPYQVSIEFNGNHGCGGTIIDCDWIVTAGHCVDGNTPPSSLVVHAGSTDQNNNAIGQRINVAEIIIHPAYTPFGGGNVASHDIALLRLVDPLDFNDDVQPIAYATPATVPLSDLAAGNTAFISGWGDSGAGCCSGDLLGASLPIISEANANTLITSGNNGCSPNGATPINNTMISFFEEGIAAGPGDSGGPAVLGSGATATLIGVSSWGGCPRDDFPTMYANVRELSDFIDDNVLPSSCCDPTATAEVALFTNCDNGNFSVSGFAAQQGPEGHYWGLFLTAVEGSTSGADTIDFDTGTAEIDPARPIQWGYTANFENLDLSDHYYIKHGIWQNGCFTWRETRTPVEEFTATAAFHFENEIGAGQTEFCVGDDIYMDGQASDGENRYFIDIWRRPIGSTGSYANYGTLGWTVGAQVGVINLTEAFANLSTPVYLEPGYQYLVKLAIANLDNCVGWTPVTHSFTLECCEDNIDASFHIGLTLGGEIQGEIGNLYENIGATHEWYLFSSPEASGGPYTYVAFSDDENFSYPNMQGELYYFLIHKVITDCGEFCYGQSICRNCPRAACELCEAFDCSMMDDLITSCEYMPAPTGLEVSGYTLSWDPMPGADYFIVESVNGSDPQIQCPRCEFNISIAPIAVATNSYTLPLSLRKKCFKWKVSAVCADNTRSEPSYPECYSGKRRRDMGDNLASFTHENLEVTVTPNPTNGALNFALEAVEATHVTIEVRDIYGQLVVQLDQSLQQHELNTISWNGSGILRTGIYFVSFKTASETIVEKIIVN